MIINLRESKLFTLDPDVRFAKEYQVPLGTWKELWRRRELMDYTNEDLRDYLFIKYVRNLSNRTIERWINRSKIYIIARPFVQKGVVHANTEIFGDLEQYVLDDLTRSLRDGNADSRIII